MAEVYLSSIGHCHGESRELAELARVVPLDESLCADGLAAYRVSDAETWQLGARAAESTLAAAGAAPGFLLYVSQNDPDTSDSLARLLDRLGLPEVRHVAISGHDCGNLAPALDVARALLVMGACERVVLVLADRASGPQQRVMANQASIFSDGAAACLVTLSPPAPVTGPTFRVVAMGIRDRVRTGAARSSAEELLTTVELARDGVADVLSAVGRDRDAFEHVVLPNYRIASQRFLTVAMGFPAESLLLGRVGELGHCFSADTLVTLHDRYIDGTLRPGGRLLASSTGPHSWSTIALEVL